MGSLACPGLHFHSDFPKHAHKFPGNTHLDLVVMHESLAQSGEALIEAVLGFPGDPLPVLLSHVAFMFFAVLVGMRAGLGALAAPVNGTKIRQWHHGRGAARLPSGGAVATAQDKG